MSWQSLEKIYLEKTAFKNVEKLSRQTINEATASEVISLIKDLDGQGLLDKEKDLEMFKKYLTTKPFSKKITDYLTKQNLNEGTIGQGDIRKYILDILTEYNDVENYSNYIDNPKKFSSLPFRGILLNEIEDISNDSITALIKGTTNISLETYCEPSSSSSHPVNSGSPCLSIAALTS